MISGDDLQNMLEHTMQSNITCPKCGTTFTFQEGVAHARARGIIRKVVACKGCNSVFEVDVTPQKVTLLSGSDDSPEDKNRKNKEKAHEVAVRWWIFTGRSAGNCDSCDASIARGQGYLVSPGTSLICEACADKRSIITPYGSEIPVPNGAVERTIEVEAKTLQEAREKILSLIPEGFYLIGENILADGSPQKMAASSETTESAFNEVLAKISPDAEIIERKEVSLPEQKVKTVTAFDETQARSATTQQFGKNLIIKDVKLSVQGTNGFLGIGKKPNWYEVTVQVPAAVEVVYKPQPKISFKLYGQPK